MDDAFKPARPVRPGPGRQTDDSANVPQSAPGDSPRQTLSKPAGNLSGRSPVDRSSGELVKDRWFTDQNGAPRIARRLNIVNEAQVVARGPLRLTGNITLIDEDGHESFHNELTLCRCGASGAKPLCDGQHIEAEFFDRGDLAQASSTMTSRAPQPLKLTCVKNGPLQFRGYLRVYNARGQECVSRVGALCRCGRSSKKPFCDCI